METKVGDIINARIGAETRKIKITSEGRLDGFFYGSDFDHQFISYHFSKDAIIHAKSNPERAPNPLKQTCLDV